MRITTPESMQVTRLVLRIKQHCEGWPVLAGYLVRERFGTLERSFHADEDTPFLVFVSLDETCCAVSLLEGLSGGFGIVMAGELADLDCVVVGGSRGWATEDLKGDLCCALDTDLCCGGLGEVDDTSCDEGATVVDADVN